MDTSSKIITRKDREFFLRSVINNLDIPESEKDIYKISIEILDDNEFSSFFENILSQIKAKPSYKRIAPLTSTLL